MKKYLFLVMVLIFCITSFSQFSTNTTPAGNNDYLQKGKHQRNAANAMLWGGMTVFLLATEFKSMRQAFSILPAKNHPWHHKLSFGLASLLWSPVFLCLLLITGTKRRA